jgi:hypothetical protein
MNHSKIILFDMGDHAYAVESSANLRSCNNLEQFSLTNSRKPRNLKEAQDAMGMAWTDRKHLSQAIPPAFAEYLARQILRVTARPNRGGQR